jgi:hypothetical protein
MERIVEGSCSRLQEPELPHGFWCSLQASRTLPKKSWKFAP